MTSKSDFDDIRQKIASIPVWYHTIELAPGIFTPGSRDCRTLLDLLDLPSNVAGKRVLDVGARDGYFSFEMEKQGAEVVALDYIPANETGFSLAKEILGSRV